MYILSFTAYFSTTVTLKVAVEMWHIPVLEQGVKYSKLHVVVVMWNGNRIAVTLTACMNQNNLECLYGLL